MLDLMLSGFYRSIVHNKLTPDRIKSVEVNYVDDKEHDRHRWNAFLHTNIGVLGACVDIEKDRVPDLDFLGFRNLLAVQLTKLAEGDPLVVEDVHKKTLLHVTAPTEK